MSGDIGTCEDLLRNIDKNTSQLNADFETFSDVLLDVVKGQQTIQKNQVAIAEAIKKVNKNIIQNIDISIEQSKYLKDIHLSRGALPDQVLDQLANIEGVSKELNKALLGGKDG